jgi:hypothetical protein
MLLRLSALGGIVFLSFHYHENPRVIIALSLVCFLLFLVIGNDEIAVYADKIIQKNTSIVSLLSKGKYHHIAEIRSAYLLKEAASTPGEVAIASFLRFILPKPRFSGSSRPNIINLELKNGKIIQLSSSLEEDKMIKVAETVNSLIAGRPS